MKELFPDRLSPPHPVYLQESEKQREVRKDDTGSDMLPIIFITGYSEFMQDGYDVEALHSDVNIFFSVDM